MELVSGDVEVTGYAIDFDHPEVIEIWIDGTFIAVADEFGLPTPEVEDRYPWLPTFMTRDAGFRHILGHHPVHRRWSTCWWCGARTTTADGP